MQLGWDVANIPCKMDNLDEDLSLRWKSFVLCLAAKTHTIDPYNISFIKYPFVSTQIDNLDLKF